MIFWEESIAASSVQLEKSHLQSRCRGKSLFYLIVKNKTKITSTIQIPRCPPFGGKEDLPFKSLSHLGKLVLFL